MAELGDSSRASHEDIGEYAARLSGSSGSSGSGLAGLIAVGEEAAPLLAGARRVPTWPGEAVAVPDGAAALDLLANRLKPGDVVLVKASRAAQLESVAAELLSADELGADELGADELGEADW
jgi:UDP-N-acetylmuramoyl-tripeptide--D-alanyl-D-alanine ligase